jgi:hypothetical protein
MWAEAVLLLDCFKHYTGCCRSYHSVTMGLVTFGVVYGPVCICVGLGA